MINQVEVPLRPYILNSVCKSVYCRYMENNTNMAPGNTTESHTARDFFLYVGAMIALYVSVGTFLAIAMVLIDRVFVDALDSVYYYDPNGGIRAAISALIVVFPIYLILTRFLNKDMVRFPEKTQKWYRKWLTSLTIFAAGSTVVVDLMIIINALLSGEVTARFIFKSIVVLVVAVLVFYYYFLDMRRDAQFATRAKVLRWVSIALVAFVVIAGFIELGSPGKNRDVRFDQERANNLSSIEWRVTEHWQTYGELPADLAVLTKGTHYVDIFDPETEETYEYRIISSSATNPTYELCATFALSSDEQGVTTFDRVGGSNWNHDAGRTCFEMEVDTIRYPVRNQETVVPKPVI